MSTTMRRVSGAVAIATAVALTSGWVLSGPPASGATSARAFCYTSFAYASRVTVGSTLMSGPSAPSQIGCTKVAPVTRANGTATTTYRDALRSGSATTAGVTSGTPVRSRSTSTVHGVDLLSGRITATAVRSVSTTAFGAGGLRLSDQGSMFVGLEVAGRSFGRYVRPNTKVTLPGIGYVVLNAQSRVRTASAASLRIDGLHVVVEDPHAVGLTGTTNLFVAHAMSGLDGPFAGLLAGAAYGSSVARNGDAASNPSFLDPMPCLGTRGATITRAGAVAAHGTALSTGTVRDDVRGTVTTSGATGTLRSTVASVRLLGGMLTATVVRAQANVALRDGVARLSDAGSSFATLRVAGFPSLGADVPRNTVVTLPGIGTLYLHRVLSSSRRIEVRMIELVVSHANRFGLPIGADVRIAVSSAAVR